MKTIFAVLLIASTLTSTAMAEVSCSYVTVNLGIEPMEVTAQKLELKRVFTSGQERVRFRVEYNKPENSRGSQQDSITVMIDGAMRGSRGGFEAADERVGQQRTVYRNKLTLSEGVLLIESSSTTRSREVRSATIRCQLDRERSWDFQEVIRQISLPANEGEIVIFRHN